MVGIDFLFFDYHVVVIMNRSVKPWFATVDYVCCSVCVIERQSMDHLKQFAAKAFLCKDFSSSQKNQIEDEQSMKKEHPLKITEDK